MTDRERIGQRLQRAARSVRDSLASRRAATGGAGGSRHAQRPRPDPSIDRPGPGTAAEQAELRELQEELAAELGRLARGGRRPG